VEVEGEEGTPLLFLRIYTHDSSSHYQTLLCDICLTVTPIVILAVASLYLGHCKNLLID